MAGVQRQKDTKGKWRYRVQFYDPTGNRHAVWLARVSGQVAKEVAGHIESLVDVGKYSTIVPAKTIGWLQEDAPENVVARLADAGLCNSREPGQQALPASDRRALRPSPAS